MHNIIIFLRRNYKMKKFIALILALVCIFSLAACGQSSAPAAESKPAAESAAEPAAEPKVEAKVYKISCGVAETHFEVAAVKEMEKYVEEATNGSIDIQIFPNNQLGDDKEALELIQQGVVQMCPTGTGVLCNFEPSFNFFSSPYLFKDYDQLNEVLGGEWGQALLATLEDDGFLGFGFGTLGFTCISNNVRPIVNAEDLEGVKLRAVSNAQLVEFWTAVGANPVAMSFTELYAALQQGVVDGQYNPFTTIEASQLHEVQKYISKTNDIPSLVCFVVGKDAFEGLTDVEQAAIKEGVKIACDYMNTKVIEENEKSEEIILAAGGTEINDVSDETKTALFLKGYEVIEKYGKQSNEELFNQLMDILGY